MNDMANESDQSIEDHNQPDISEMNTNNTQQTYAGINQGQTQTTTDSPSQNSQGCMSSTRPLHLSIFSLIYLLLICFRRKFKCLAPNNEVQCSLALPPRCCS